MIEDYEETAEFEGFAEDLFSMVKFLNGNIGFLTLCLNLSRIFNVFDGIEHMNYVGVILTLHSSVWRYRCG